MEAIECIKSRRSYRKYEEKAVPEELLAEVVEAARFAPSWKNSQTVRFHAVYDDDVRMKVAENCTLGHANNPKIISRAPLLIVLSSVKKVAGYEPDGSFTTPHGSHWQSFDAGIAAEAFCLAAHAKGLCSVILGIFDPDKVKETIGLPDDQVVSALIAVGFPPEGDKKAPKRLEVSELLTLHK